ncbi:unnamed protein product [Parnassius apollo]|uniref:(apollo) hypothetical protein n=1 Tax=Parnassius apollo TaxID=110799 RepID=A0A8S3WJN4_PARAO|nr:unnamed protein product [Parnassius apollo]
MALTIALKEALTRRGGPVAQPKYIHELPYFDDNSSEWLAFKVVYKDTAPMFNAVQNMSRLRRALKKCLQFSGSDGMTLLQQRERKEGEFSDLTMVSKFLNSEADKCGAFATSEEKSGFRRTHRQATHSTREKDFKERDSRQSTEKNCPMCQGGHFLVDCQKFQKTSVQDRWATVKKSYVCFKCLQEKHRKESCKKPPCKECKIIICCTSNQKTGPQERRRRKHKKK